MQEVRREECTACGRRHKNFPQSYVVDGQRLTVKPDGFAPVLYRLPRVAQALGAGERVWILEGEKDVHTAEGLGLVATTNPGGAGSFSGSFPPSSAPMFADADVAVVLDRDDAGWKRGIELASLLGGAGAASVQLLLPATPTPKSDFTDHVAAGMWSEDDPWGGLAPVQVGEVAAHAYAADVRAKAHAVEVALEQATLRSDRAAAAEPGSNEAGEEFARAQRWAIEAERRFEPLADLVDRVRRQATEVGTDWVAVAVDEAVEAWRQARVAARATFELVGMDLPPLLHDPEPDRNRSPTTRRQRTIGSGRRQTTRRPAATRSRAAAARCSGVARSSPRCTGSPTATWSRSSPTRRPGNSRRSWCSESTRVWWRWSTSRTPRRVRMSTSHGCRAARRWRVRPRRIRRRPRN